MKIAITGSSGYIGAEFLLHLEKEGFNVTLLSRSPETLQHRERHLCLYQNLNDHDPWKNIPIESFDYIIHLAALDLSAAYDPHEDFQINAKSVLTLLQNVALRNPQARIMFTSSANIYGMRNGEIADEKSRIIPLSLWALHKQLAESYLKTFRITHGIKSIILRLPNIYGPGACPAIARRSALNRSIKECLASGKLVLFPNRNCHRDYLHITDVSKALVAGIKAFPELEADQTFNVSHDSAMTILQVWNLTKKYCSKKLGTIVPLVISERAMSPFEFRDFRLDGSLFQKMTGWKSEIGIHSGLKNTVDFFWEESNKAVPLP